MSQVRTILRELWSFPNPAGGYPGAFPRGLLHRIEQHGWLQYPVLHVCSGSLPDDPPRVVTLDIKQEVNPSVVGDAENLPFRDNAFGTAIADPPYTREFARTLYGLDRAPDPLRLVREMARVVRPGGYVILLHYLVGQGAPGLRPEAPWPTR